MDRCYKRQVSRYLLTIHPKLPKPPVICCARIWVLRFRRTGRRELKSQAMMKKPEFGRLPGRMQILQCLLPAQTQTCRPHFEKHPLPI